MGKRGQVWLSFHKRDPFRAKIELVRPSLLPIIYVRMTLEEFRELLNSEHPPEDLTLR
jgi:hypothetical protein